MRGLLRAGYFVRGMAGRAGDVGIVSLLSPQPQREAPRFSKAKMNQLSTVYTEWYQGKG